MAIDIQVNLEPFFKQLQPVALKELKASLQDTTKLAQIQDFQNELISLVASLEAQQFQYEKYLDQTSHITAYQKMIGNKTLSQISLEQKSKMVINANFNQLVQKLFILEHKIMAFLAKSTETTEYRVFYSDPNHTEKVLEKSIKPEELYQMNLVNMSNEGKLIGLRLTINQVLKSQAKALAISQADMNKVAQLAKEAIANMLTRLQELEDMMKYTHLGGQNWKRLQELRVLLGDEDQGQRLSELDFNNISLNRINTIIDYYTKNKTLNVQIHRRTLGKNKRTYVRKATYNIRTSQNRGHIYEALVRMRRDLNMSSFEALERSLGHDIWWAQGDVGSTQIKTILGNTKFGGQVGIASINSIFDLANYLLNILANFKNTTKMIDQYLEKQIAVDFNSINYEKINRYASQEAIKKIEELISIIQK